MITKEEQEIDSILQLYLPDDYYKELREKLVPRLVAKNKELANTELSKLREENERLEKRFVNFELAKKKGMELVAETEKLIDVTERLQSDKKELIKCLTNISNQPEYEGRKGCTYGDTEFDSLSAAHGYNDCLSHIKWILEDLLAKHSNQKNE